MGSSHTRLRCDIKVSGGFFYSSLNKSRLCISNYPVLEITPLYPLTQEDSQSIKLVAFKQVCTLAGELLYASFGSVRFELQVIELRKRDWCRWAEASMPIVKIRVQHALIAVYGHRVTAVSVCQLSFAAKLGIRICLQKRAARDRITTIHEFH